ncbi:hypothetical protein NX783_02570 [Massilia kyonggiensis]|jgi:hypothetical protein|nr:hypothetical protein [Massilia sp. JS1662]MCS0611628.1 hypothetical protein [Massilia kyonggiensis]
MREFSDDNEGPVDPQPAAGPHFGRLLVVLMLAVLLIIGITFLSEAYLG